ncbi:hypothetical protein [Streptomyces sp. NPDC049555]|uniref:hypothetical protein n=1 Tax=Streptomyces sp. NPDC049555 TaxID=3154930 RepID=UPI0034382186
MLSGHLSQQTGIEATARKEPEHLRIRTWLLRPGQPTETIDLFAAENFYFVVADRTDMNIAKGPAEK